MKYIELMKNDNKNQTELSKLFGVAQRTISAYLSGESQPNIATLCKIAEYYGVSLDYLCDYKSSNQLDYGQIDDAHKKAHNILQSLPDAEFYVEFGRLQTKADMLGIKY